MQVFFELLDGSSHVFGVGGVGLDQVNQLGGVGKFTNELAVPVQPLFVRGYLLEDCLGRLVVRPESLGSGFQLKVGDFGLEAVEVKDTSLACRVVREAQGFGFVFQLSAQCLVLKREL
jgi:hypothetical protein